MHLISLLRHQPHAAGAVNVVVTNGDGQTASGGTGAFTYVTPAPTFISIAPSSGSTAGGTPVIITGANFVTGGSLGVTFGGQPVLGVSVTDASHIAATTPAHAAGAVNVVITNGDGQIALGGTGAFTYVTPATGRCIHQFYATLRNCTAYGLVH